MVKLSIVVNTTTRSNISKLYLQLVSLFYENNKEDIFEKEIDYRLLIKDLYGKATNYNKIRDLTLYDIINIFEQHNFKRIEPSDYELIFVIDNIGNGYVVEHIRYFINVFKVANYLIIESDVKINISISRNLGIMNASGIYIIFCDDDDIHCPISDVFSLIKSGIKNVPNFDFIDTRNICVKSENLGIFKSMETSNGVWGLIFSVDFLRLSYIYFIPSLSITEDGLLINRILMNLNPKVYTPTEMSLNNYFYYYLMPSFRYSFAMEDDTYRDFLVSVYGYDIINNNRKKAQLTINYRLTSNDLVRLKSPYHNDYPIHKDEVIPIRINNKYRLSFVTNSHRNTKISSISNWKSWNDKIRNDCFIKSW